MRERQVQIPQQKKEKESEKSVLKLYTKRYHYDTDICVQYELMTMNDY